MKKLLFAEKAFTVLSLIHYSGAPLVLILTGGASEGDESGGGGDFFLIQLLFFVIYLITFILLVLRWKKVIQVIPKSKLIWLLLVLAVLSFFWSDQPAITQVRVIALIGTLLFPLYLASRYSLKEQLELLAWAFGIAIISSIFLIVAVRSYGRMGGIHFGSWRGIYNHKNVLGKVMVPSAIVFLLLALKAKKHTWILWCGFFLSLVLIKRSNSSTALVNVLILFIELWLLRIVRWRYHLMIPALMGLSIITIVAYILLTTNAAAIASALGKDLTLSGRTNFWPLVLDKIWERPLLGYGFGAFWWGFQGQSAYIWYAISFKAPNSHNGYLDLCLELGFVGLSIYLMEYIRNFWKSLVYIRKVKTSEGFWPIIYLTYIVLCNLTESTLIIQNNFFFVLQVAIFLSINIPKKPENMLILDDNGEN